MLHIKYNTYASVPIIQDLWHKSVAWPVIADGENPSIFIFCSNSQDIIEIILYNSPIVLEVKVQDTFWYKLMLLLLLNYYAHVQI